MMLTPTKPLTGRPSIFRGKDRARPIRAILTALGHVAFTQARKDLAKMVKLPVKEISLNDTFEYCVRGRPQLVPRADGTYEVVETQVPDHRG